jgi:hypothetical protein
MNCEECSHAYRCPRREDQPKNGVNTSDRGKMDNR